MSKTMHEPTNHPTASQIHRLQRALQQEPAVDERVIQECPCCFHDWVVAAFAANTITPQEEELWRPYLEACSLCQERLRNWQATLEQVESQSPQPPWQEVLVRGQSLAAHTSPLPPELPGHDEAPTNALTKAGLKQGREASDVFTISLLQKLRRWLDGWQPFPIWLGTFAVVLCVVWLDSWSFRDLSMRPDIQQGIRAKGASVQASPQTSPRLLFQYYHRRGDRIRLGQAHMTFHAGDQLRFVYWNEHTTPLYLLLWSVNAQGQLTALYPGKDEGPFRLLADSDSARKTLPGGVILDHTTTAERFYVCVTKRPLSYQQVQQVQHLIPAATRSVMPKPQSIPLPCLYQTSWLFVRR